MKEIVCQFGKKLWHLFVSQSFRTLLILGLLGISIVQMVGSRQWYSNMKEGIIALDRHIDTVKTEKWIHFSLDDSIEVFKDITRNQYESIFENEELRQLKRLHDSYGLVVSLYCFYEKNGFDLSMVTDKYSTEFSENASWLKVGFHSYDENTNYALENGERAHNDYNAVITELLRITGSSECIDHIPRVHLYAGNERVIQSWNGGGEECARGYLSADDDRDIYLFNSDQSKYISQLDYYYDIWNGIYFVPTDIRLEKVDDLELALTEKSDDKYLIIFTHEWALDTDMYIKIEKCCKYAQERGYSWAYVENTLE